MRNPFGRQVALAFAGITLAAGAVVLALVAARDNAAPSPAQPAAIDARPAAPSPPDEALRRLLVFSSGEPAPSVGTALRAQLVGGVVPAEPTVALVLTDEDCAPDAAGISHCLNALRLPDGSTLAVRHPHDMSAVPCLTPGERVAVEAA